MTDVSWELFNSTSVKVMWKSPSSPVKQFNITMVPLDGSVPIYLLVNGSRSSTEVCYVVFSGASEVFVYFIVCVLTVKVALLLFPGAWY